MNRFAKILYMDIDQNQAHVQWLEHGSQTYLEELAHPQELFYNDLCGHIPFQTIVAPIVVHECPNPQFVVDPEHYFIKYVFRTCVPCIHCLCILRLITQVHA